MKYLCAFLLLCCISVGSYAKEDVTNKQELFITKLMKQQVKQQISVKKSVSSILKRYPEKIDSVLNVALELYPDKHKEIMLGALHAEPVLACNVIEHFLMNSIASSSELVQMVIETEPAYAQEILNSAILHDPDNMEEIVRIALLTEPLTSREILSSTMTSFPERMVDILAGFVKAIPDKVAQWIAYTFVLFPDSGEQIVSTAITSTNDSHNKEIIEAALDAGLERKLVISAAIEAGDEIAYKEYN